MENKETLENLFQGTELTEEAKQNFTVLFEASVASKVEELKEAIETEFREELEENVDKYATYAAETFLEENAVALESGFKVELAEKIIAKHKELVEMIGVDVPEDQVSDFEKLQESYDALQEKLEAQEELVEELQNKLTLMSMEKTIDAVSEGLVVSEKETFVKLVENIEYISEEQYSKDIALVKERFFKKQPVVTEKLDESVNLSTVTKETPKVSKGSIYATAIKAQK